MKKKSKLIIALLSFCFPIFIASAGIVQASANSYAMASTWGFGPEEKLVQKSVCENITTYSDWMDYTWYNWYGSETEKHNILDAAAGGGASKAISYYTGHGNRDEVGGLYWIEDSDSFLVKDSEIYDETGEQITKFAFLFSCLQAEVISGGMPEAWLHTANLSSDGYHYPDGNGLTFIGFKQLASQLHEKVGGVNNAGGRFSSLFYWFSYYYTYCPVKHALDYASWELWGPNVDFDECPLYVDNEMRVYGDGDLKIGALP